ncbi:MAG: bifunctional riboflavin kinase/FAD synthetase [Thermomicrobiales bacterium]
MKSVATIGTFDGVHRGHQALIAKVVERAKLSGIQSAVVTFEPIPISVLRPELYRGRLTTPEEKLRLLHQSGADHIEVVPFTMELAALEPEEFLKMLIEKIGMVELWIGDDFALGRNRSGSIEVIRDIGAEAGYSTNVYARLPQGDSPISSTAIRKAIESGDVNAAATMLGRPFRVSGEVIHGAHLGRQIGYPTANFAPPGGMIQLADGIYASTASVPGHFTDQQAMTYIGTRPTVDGVDRQVETNVLDFDGDLYGTWLTLDLIERVRPDQTFDGLEPLIEQLSRDEVVIRGILARHVALKID